LNLVTPFFEPTRCQRPDRIFISQTGYLSDQFLSAKFLSGIWGDIYQPNMYYSAKYLLFSQMGIIQSNIIQPNIIQPNQILFSQMKYYSAKWEYYSAKLRGGWRPKAGASWRNHYIVKYAGRRGTITFCMCV
jgi:hypothetical protein